jgi:hypothetical protein
MVAEAIAPAVLPDGVSHHYGFGIIAGRDKGLPVLSHGGLTGGYRSALLRYPEQQLSVALLCNSGYDEAQRDARKVAALFLEKAFKPGSGSLPNPPLHRRLAGMDQAPDTSERALQELVGRYASTEAEATITMALDKGTLVARVHSGRTIPLTAAFRDAFRSSIGTVIFRRDTDGKVNAVSIGDESNWDMRFERQQ